VDDESGESVEEAVWRGVQSWEWDNRCLSVSNSSNTLISCRRLCGSVAEWLACWTQAQLGPGFKSQSLHCRVTVLGKLFTPIVPLFTKQ